MKGFQCDELFAFVAVDEDDNEGIVMATTDDGVLPLVSSSLESVKSMVPIASHVAQQNKINIQLYHYKRMGEVSDEFIDQFVGVRLTGDPGGDGEVPVPRGDEGPTEPSSGGGRGNGNGGTPVA